MGTFSIKSGCRKLGSELLEILLGMSYHRFDERIRKCTKRMWTAKKINFQIHFTFLGQLQPVDLEFGEFGHVLTLVTVTDIFELV
jgi:hypothetical protein